MNKFIGEYNKLVRDGIPAIVTKDGLTPVVRRLDDDEYEKELYIKLVEEAKEVQESIGSVEELADLLEVVRAICKVKGYNVHDVEDTRTIKRQQRGGFDEKVFLERIIE